MMDADEVPTSVATLHGLARANGRRLEVRAATSAEIETISGELNGCAPVGGHIADWRVVAVQDHGSGRTSMHFLGHHKSSHPWISGPIAAITSDRVLARAGGLVYGLGDESAAEWSPEFLVQALAALRDSDNSRRGHE